MIYINIENKVYKISKKDWLIYQKRINSEFATARWGETLDIIRIKYKPYINLANSFNY